MPQENKTPPITSTDEDDVISRTIGEYGRWQLYLTFLLSLVNIPCTWHIFAPTFYALERETWCARPSRFRNFAPILWKNFTQPESFCEVRDVWSSNVTEEQLVLQYDELQMVACTAWEFAGEGNRFTTDSCLNST